MVSRMDDLRAALLSWVEWLSASRSHWVLQLAVMMAAEWDLRLGQWILTAKLLGTVKWLVLQKE